MALDEVLNLDVGEAQRAIDNVERDLTHAAQVFNNGIVDALSQLTNLEVDATGLTRSIDSAIAAADTTVRVTATAGDVEVAVEGAVAAADTQVSVTGDASELTGAVTAAVDAADTTVTVTGDAAPLAGSVQGALDSASPFGPVEVEGSVSPKLQGDISNLGANLADASDSASVFKTVLAGLSLGAAARGILTLVTAASDLAESQSKANVVFGDSVGVINDFTRSSATSLGLAQGAALETTGTFGNLFNALGLTKSAAADLAPDVVQLGADLASFNNLNVDDALEKLRSGLVGEIEPLRSLGISFTAAQVDAKALELGLADATGQISESAKVQARWALIVAQSTNASGDFARTSDGLANQQRILAAEFHNVITAAGQELLPTLLDLVSFARKDLIPSLGELGGEVLPALGDILEHLAPLLGSTLDIFVALSPVITAVANIIEVIPTPLLAMAGAALAANKALNFASGLKSVQALSRGLGDATGVLAGFGAAGPLLGTIGVGVAALGVAAIASGEGVDGLAGSVLKLADSFTGFGKKRESKVLEEIKQSLGEMDLTKLDNAAKAVGILKGELGDLDDEVGKGRLFSVGGVNVFGTGGDADRQERIDQVKEQIKVLEDQSQAEITGGLNTGVYTEKQVAAAKAAAKRAGDESIVIGTLSRLQDEQTRAAAAAQEIIDKYAPLVGIFTQVGGAIGGVRAEAPELADTLDQLGSKTAGVGDPMLALALGLGDADLSADGLASTAAVLGISVQDLQGFIEGTTGAIEDMASAAESALPTIADAFQAALSDSQQAIQDDIDGIRSSGSSRADAVRSAGSDAAKAEADSASDQIKSIKDGADDRAKAVQEAADKEADAISKAANSGRNTLTRDSELERAKAVREAGRDQAAAIKDAAADQADALRDGAAARADSIREGSDAEADAIRAGADSRAEAIDADGTVTAAALTRSLEEQAGKIGAFHLRLQAITDAGFADLAALVAEQGPDLGGDLARELADAVGRGDTAMLDKLREAKDHFNTEFSSTTTYLRDVLGPEFILTSGLLGASAADAFGKDLDFGERIRIATELAATDLDTQGQAIAAVAAVEGAAAGEEYGKALGLEQKVIDEAVAAGIAIKEHNPVGDAQVAGADLGKGYKDGIILGLGDLGPDIGALLASGNEAAIRFAKERAGIESPSKLFARELGLPIAQGIAVGISSGSAEVIAEAERIVAEAAAVGFGGSDSVLNAIRGADASSIERSLAASPRSSGSTAALTLDPRLIAALEQLASNPQIGQNIERVDMTVLSPEPVTSGIAVNRKLQSRANTRRY